LQLDPYIDQFEQAASRLISRNWARSFFGNISILVDADLKDLPIKNEYPSPVTIKDLKKNCLLMVTRTTSTMSDIIDSPEDSLGLYLLKDDNLNLIWGCGPPTSELSAHLLAYSSSNARAIIHCHMDIISKLSDRYPRGPPLPANCSWVGDLEPGSIDLAEATAEALESTDTVIWKHHGVISCTGDLSKCYWRIEEVWSYLNYLLDDG
jgi:ribulose-5-phosphate 4-epimerase/fuculose-1-phosphate aldolase